MRGKIDRVFNETIYGWVWNPLVPEQRITAKVIVNGVDAGLVVADAKRGDLEVAGIGDGHHSFRLKLPLSAANAPIVRVILLVDLNDSGTYPIIIDDREFNFAESGVLGRVVPTEAGAFAGWAYVAPRGSRVVKVSAKLAGRTLLETLSDRPSDVGGYIRDVGGFALDLRQAGEIIHAGSEIDFVVGPEEAETSIATVVLQATVFPNRSTSGSSTSDQHGEDKSSLSMRLAEKYALDADVASRIVDEVVSTPPFALPDHVKVAGKGGGVERAPQVEVSSMVDVLSNVIRTGSTTSQQAGDLVEVAFKSGQWLETIAIGEAARVTVGDTHKILSNLGRAYLNARQYEQAIAAFEALKALDPKRHGAMFFLARAYAQIHEYELAYQTIQGCIIAEGDQANFELEAARLATLLTFGGYGIHRPRPEFEPQAIEHYLRAAALSPTDSRAFRGLAALYLSRGRYKEALANALEATKLSPENEVAWSELSKTYLRMGKIRSALKAAQTAAELGNGGDGGSVALRIIGRLRGESDGKANDTIAYWGESADMPAVPGFKSMDFAPRQAKDLKTNLHDCSATWIAFEPGIAPADPERVEQLALDWAAMVELASDDGVFRLWRREFLLSLIESELFAAPPTLPDLLEKARAVAAIAASPASTSPERQKPRVLLVSRYGVKKFGGAEQFLEQTGFLYKKLGYDVILVGTQNDLSGQSGHHDGLQYAFIGESVADMLRFAVQNAATLVHVVSGLGYEVGAAFRFTNIDLIFGVHFWRELFHNPTPSAGYFPDIDQVGQPRSEFELILRDYSAIYSNSEFTRDLLERTFGIRTPVIYSIPHDEPQEDVAGFDDRSFVLLANARVDKGFDLLLKAAARVPQVKFVVIASQSGENVARRLIAEQSIENVEVLAYVENMPSLYKKARAVLVPSFQFVETFSRVVIEAQRFGVPVIGSDRGNVPRLLENSGTILSDDPG